MGKLLTSKEYPKYGKGDRVFLLRTKARPTLEIIGPVIASPNEVAEKTENSLPSEPNRDVGKAADDDPSVTIGPKFEASAPRRRVVGPEMPSAELLAAAAKLTDAQAEL
ncbi:Catalase-peroxidase 2 [Bienertia sinuspersici]